MCEVDLQDDGELVRLDQVNDGHRPAHQNTETSGNEHKSEAPTEGKLNGGLLEADDGREGRRQ